MSDTAFQLLHEGVRRKLWDLKWPELRPLQRDAIHAVLERPGHVVLSAATAAGKTEAAFLPVLSAIADEAEGGGVRAIYVGPLKALINDQFARVEDLCRHLDVPVHRWHGDVGAGDKSRLVEFPGGVLLITPESLESLFVNRSRHLTKLFAGLRFVVIDEMHAFLGNERGRHLRSLLYRLAAFTEKPLRIIGLSATLGDITIARRYVNQDAPDSVTWLEGKAAETELKLKVHAYETAKQAEIIADASANTGDFEHADNRHVRDMAADILSHCRGHANLIFANSRNDVEQVGEHCATLAREQALPDEILVHHGSLSADHRHDTERQMKHASDTGRAATAFCTSTLEMGIDIGNVRLVGQIGPPGSVASLKQRIGRSGRRAGSSRMLRVYLECEAVDDKSSLFSRLHLGLVQTIAVIELLREGWVEPAEASSFDLSTLTHQIISLIAETGGRRVADVFRILCQHGVFREVDQATFVALLRQLAKADVIEQTGPGELILGLIGEKLRKDKGFYAAFPSAEPFVVLHDGRRVGTVDGAPLVEHHLILAGRRWRVRDVDQTGKTVYVIPAHGKSRTPFAGGGGLLHPRVVARMREVLGSDQPIAYLNDAGARLLEKARVTASTARVCTDGFVPLDLKTTAVMTWAGTRTTDTLRALLLASGIEAVDVGVALVIKQPADDVRRRLGQLMASSVPDAFVLTALRGPPPGKYDSFLDDPLKHALLRQRWLDLPAAVDVLRRLTDPPLG